MVQLLNSIYLGAATPSDYGKAAGVVELLPFDYYLGAAVPSHGKPTINVLLSGVSPLTLVNAIKLNYVKAFGKCEQDLTPTPSTPSPIICNNGVIKYGKPITLDDTRIYAYINMTGSWAWASDSYSIALPVTVGKKYRIIISSTVSSIVGTIFRYGFTDSSPDDFKQKEDTPSPASISVYDYWRGTPQDLSDVEVTATHPYMVIQFAAAYASIIVSTYLTVKDQSIYYDGTAETIEDTIGNTATTEMLLKVGDYQDEQEILSGVVTRNVNIKVLDGTEDWTPMDQYSRTSIQITTMKNPASARTLVGYCNYFANLHNSEPISTITAGQFYIATPQRVYFHISQATTADFKAWLAEKYAAGTPVIVVYPLATPTTETVTGQTLTITQGTNVVSAEGSVDNLELEVSYKAYAEVTVEEIEAVNTDENVEVTIS